MALHQAGDAGQVGVQPVLRTVGPGGLPEVGHHQVDVVLELRDLAAGADRDGLGQVALSRSSHGTPSGAEILLERHRDQLLNLRR